MNLPGDPSYNRWKVWVCMERKDGALAAWVLVYLNDERSTGPTEGDFWLASQRLSSFSGNLGIQDAMRKRRPPSFLPILTTIHQPTFRQPP